MRFFSRFAWARELKRRIWVTFEFWDYPDKDVCDIIRKYVKKGYICLDVGAHRGRTAREMAKKASMVHAFEPVRRAYVEIPRRKNIKVHPLALADSCGKRTIYEGVDTRQSSFHKHRVPSIVRDYEVHVSTIDILRLGRVDFIKIDVQWSDLAVLRGARETIRLFRPVIVVECAQDCTDRQAMLDFLHSFGYETTEYPMDILATNRERVCNEKLCNS